jgi:hypothetical protein
MTLVWQSGGINNKGFKQVPSRSPEENRKLMTAIILSSRKGNVADTSNLLEQHARWYTDETDKWMLQNERLAILQETARGVAWALVCLLCEW